MFLCDANAALLAGAIGRACPAPIFVLDGPSWRAAGIESRASDQKFAEDAHLPTTLERPKRHFSCMSSGL